MRADVEKAEQALEEGRFGRALTLLRGRPAPHERPRALYLQAEALRGQGYFKASAPLYARLLAGLSPYEDPVLYLDASLALCGVLHSLGRIAESRRALERGEAARRRLGLSGYERAFRLERVMLDRAAGRYLPAIAGLKRELRFAADDAERGYLWWAMGGALRFSGSLADSEGAFKESLSRYRAAKDELGAAYALCGLGGISRVRGKLPAAAVFYARAAAFFERNEDRFGAAYGQCGLSNVLRQLGQWKEAEAGYRRAYALYDGLGDAVDLAYVDWGLGGVLEKTGRPREALSSYRRGLGRFQAYGETRGVVLSLLSLARLSHLLGKSAEGEKLFDKAVALSRRAGMRAHLESFI